MDKVALLFLGSICGAMIGVYFRRRLYEKKEYFDSFCDFINDMLNNLAYLQLAPSDMPIGEIKSFLFHKQLSEYYLYSGDTYIPVQGFLTNEEYGVVCAFFGSLGKSNIASEINNLSYFSSKLTSFRNNAEDHYRRKQKSIIKLGLMGGLALGIILM